MKFLAVTTLFFTMLALPFWCIGQINFAKGYYIDNAGQKVECLIKDKGWGRNPSSITYKLSETAESKKLDINEVNEFIVSGIKFKRFTVNVDQSSTDVNKISKTREPIFEEKTLLLRAVIEGEATLFTDNEDRYFYYMGNSRIEQLIYKEYHSNSNGMIMVNKDYTGQLLQNLKCDKISFKDIQDVDFTKKDLTDIFIKYNVCINPNFSIAELDSITPQKEGAFNFNLIIKPGISYSSLVYKYKSGQASTLSTIDYGSNLNFIFGMEAEFILPINKNKWAVFLEPTYQYFKAEDPTDPADFPYTPYVYDVDFKTIDLPLGIKHYFFLSKNSKLFISGAFVLFSMPLGSTLGRFEISRSFPFKFGLGYMYGNKFSLEIKYDTERNLLDGYQNKKTLYNSSAIVIGYNIF